MAVMRSVFITGADKGLGQALVRHYAGLEYQVYPHYLGDPGLSPVQLNGGKPSSGDLSRRQILSSVVQLVESLPDLELLISVAAKFPRTPIDSVSFEEWESVLGLNLTAPFHLAQAALRSYRRRQSGGKLIFIGSVSASTGSPSGAHYAASKAGLNTLAKCFSRAGQKQNIFAYSVAPGLLDTDMSRSHLDAAGFDAVCQTVPQGRATQLEEVVDTVSFLSERDRGALAGQVLHANGGIYI
jgi:3-oxoacyl-[acyl-carrier protein] reductase